MILKYFQLSYFELLRAFHVLISLAIVDEKCYVSEGNRSLTCENEC